MCAATIRARALCRLTLQAVAVVGAPSAFLQAFSYGKYNTMRFRKACSCFGASVRAGSHVGVLRAHAGVRLSVLRVRMDVQYAHAGVRAGVRAGAHVGVRVLDQATDGCLTVE